MNDSEAPRPEPGLEVRSYFVRGRNALLTRADFGELYVDYYLHQGQLGAQHEPAHDGLLKQALAAVTLHAAARPWSESIAWTIHLRDPLLNLFVAGDNRLGTVIGQLFTDDVKDVGHQLFVADVVRERADSRRSAVEFTGSELIIAPHHFNDEDVTSRLPADLVVFCTNPEPNRELYAALSERNTEVRVVGDANSPRFLSVARVGKSNRARVST